MYLSYYPEMEANHFCHLFNTDLLSQTIFYILYSLISQFAHGKKYFRQSRQHHNLIKYFHIHSNGVHITYDLKTQTAK